jgi:hypothetical protein
MQAQAGDFGNSLATARSIPELERAKLNEPRGDFHDAHKPITLGLSAGLQAKAGDQTAAAATLAQAEALAAALKADDERLVAQVVIALKNGEAGRTDVAKRIVAQLKPVALVQTEPRRSRLLAMVAKVELRVGDRSGALATGNAIRDFPGIEKAEVLTLVAQWHEQRGDEATSRTLLQRALVCLEAKVSDKPLAVRVMNMNDWARDTFASLDNEFMPEPLENVRQQTLGPIRAALGDVETAIRDAKALPKPRGDWALASIVRGLASRGDIAGALKLAESIESPQGRVDAYQMAVMGISDHKLLRY